MKKLKGLWIDEGKPISNSDRLLKINLNQIIIANKIDELVAVHNWSKDK